MVAVRSWRPVARSVAIVVIVPGFNAHSGRYQWVAEQLCADGISSYAVDLRGRGESEGERFHVAKFAEYVSDVAATIKLARSDNPSTPMFLLGHSAGGVVACLAALDQQQELAGLISESFSFELPAPGFALAALKGLAHIMPHAHVVRLKNAFFSRDDSVVRSMDEDPLIVGETETASTIAEMTRASAQLGERFTELNLPILILHGTADKIAKPSGSQRFYDTASSSDKTLKLYEGHFHDLLNDVDKERVLKDITRWIGGRRLSALAQGSQHTE